MTIYRSLFRLNCLSVLLVALLILLTKWSDLEVSELFSHPFFSPHPNVAFLTRTFQLLCVVPFIVCTFSYGLLKTIQTHHSEERFILCSAVFTGAFLFNEIYRIHLYCIAAGVPKLGVVLFYAFLLSSYGWCFRRELQSTPYQIGLAGLGLLFVAMAVDLLHLKGKVTSSLLEGVPKLFSEINIAFYYWYVCKSFIEKAFHKLSKPPDSLVI